MITEQVSSGTCQHQVWRDRAGGKKVLVDCGETAVVWLSNWNSRSHLLCRNHAENLMSRLQEIIAKDD